MTPRGHVFQEIAFVFMTKRYSPGPTATAEPRRALRSLPCAMLKLSTQCAVLGKNMYSVLHSNSAHKIPCKPSREAHLHANTSCGAEPSEKM